MVRRRRMCGRGEGCGDGEGCGRAKDVASGKKAGTYVVQAGDTLEKIARKLAPTKMTETVAKLTKSEWAQGSRIARRWGRR